MLDNREDSRVKEMFHKLTYSPPKVKEFKVVKPVLIKSFRSSLSPSGSFADV